MNDIYEKLKALSNFVDTEINERKNSIDKKIKNKEFAYIELAAYAEAVGIKKAMKKLNLYIGED